MQLDREPSAATAAFRNTSQLSQAEIGKYLVPDDKKGDYWYQLSPEGRGALRPTFDKLGYDVDTARFHVGYTIENAGGINRTIGNNVYLVASDWARATPDQQLFLLGHELTHSVQWTGGAQQFVSLYLREEVAFDQAQQYGVSTSLANTPIEKLDTSTNWNNRMYTLDEVADRVGIEVSPGEAYAHSEAKSAYGY
ncbi:MAG TPA: DUF4157 domain-containing protein [Polyangiaceae bacterium]